MPLIEYTIHTVALVTVTVTIPKGVPLTQARIAAAFDNVNQAFDDSAGDNIGGECLYVQIMAQDKQLPVDTYDCESGETDSLAESPL